VKFAHISDTHIKNLKYHYEYRIIFEQLYETLREQKVDYIIHCGDIAHTKTQISPEFVEMCSDFFRSLAEIAPTYIILGNHDGNLKNSSRQDALTPIVDALDMPTLHLLKNSGETHLNDEFCLNVLSVFDRDKWMKPSNTDKINIALYHGSISNCKTDTNWTMSFGEDDISIFDDFDFAMLGDIHRRQFLDHDGRVWYAGSTVQQNHGETNDKGLLIWEIDSKDEWEIEPLVFKNPKPFFTIPLTLKGRMPRNLQVPAGARLRLVSNNNLPLNTMRRAMDIAKHRFNPESISFLNRAAGERGNVEDLADGIKTENLRDIKVQEELIDEFLSDYQTDTTTLERVFELNSKYNKIIEDREEISRNVNWKLKSFKWDNLFNYGKGNSINFENLNGIIGVFGKNFSGKSSIIDAVLYTLFNTTSKNERKNLNLINQHQESCEGVLEIEIGHKVYNIKRISEKYTKRLKGVETLEAKTDLNFEVYDPVTDETTSLNGTTRTQTDANIRKHFGSMDDFLVSSLASQHGALTFIDEGSTRRKEIIAKFLDLELFEQKFKMAKDDSIEAKALLRKYENRDYSTELTDLGLNLEGLRLEADVNKITCEKYRQNLKILNEGARRLDDKINSIPGKLIDITKTLADQKEKENLAKMLQEKIAIQETDIDLKQQKVVISEGFLELIDLSRLTEDKEEIEILGPGITNLREELEKISKKEKLLKRIPCGDQFPSCHFIKDAYIDVANKPGIEEDLHTAMNRLNALDPIENVEKLEEYRLMQELIQELKTEVAELLLECERNKNTKAATDLELAETKTKVKEYNQNKKVIDGLEKLINERKTYENKIETKKEKILTCDEETLELVKQIGSYEEKITSLKQQEQEYKTLQNDYAAYDLLMRCMHPNGIAYDIIKKKIPVINQEIAKVLANIVEFEVFFETGGNKLDIFIKHPKHDERPIEMASGAEKTMGAMAIRLALLSVSSLPKSDLFILDEPGTALDEENMEGFIRILELIKVYFKNVLLISHLDSLKDCVDMQIVIEKKKGYAKVNQ
jgi:DNA repair exonuclease SbcCD ATPase subunit/predicted phosphodiesterase